MRVRKMTDAGDMPFGRGQGDFIQNTPETVGQVVGTRLAEYTGDWFLDITAGTPWRIDVLGKRTESTRDPAMRARILSTQGVQGIVTYASQVDRNTRGYAVQATIDTIYGQTLVATARSGPNGDVRYSR